ncbi:MAG: hypothetical protein PVH02_18965 [Desulfobacteraceae bacterium]|jgi:hypothetical protein
MDEIIVISRGAESDENLITLLQAMFPGCKTRIVYQVEKNMKKPTNQGDENDKYAFNRRERG